MSIFLFIVLIFLYIFFTKNYITFMKILLNDIGYHWRANFKPLYTDYQVHNY